MRVIKQGTLPELVEIERTCGKCHTVFAYVQKDVRSDSRDGDYVECPLCKSFIDVRLDKQSALAEAYYKK